MYIYIHTKNQEGEINKASILVSQTENVKRLLLERLEFNSDNNGEFRATNPKTNTEFVITKDINFVF